jgi:hypothetical protein
MISTISLGSSLRKFPSGQAMLSNKEAVVQAVEICSEIGVAGQRLHLDKGTVRKDRGGVAAARHRQGARRAGGARPPDSRASCIELGSALRSRPDGNQTLSAIALAEVEAAHGGEMLTEK